MNTMNAFFSVTDDANENQTQFYGVWGKVTDKNPQFAFRYVVGNSKIEVPGDVLFEWPKVEVKKKVETNYIVDGTEDALFTIEDEFLSKVQEQSFVEDGDTTVQLFPGPFKMIDYPEDWMGQHSTRVYAYAGARTVGWGSAYPETDYAQKWGNSQLSKRHGGDFSGPRTSGVNAGTENPVQKSNYLDSFAGSDYLSDNFPYECCATPLDTTPLSSEAEKEVQEMFAEIIADKETFENLT